MQATEATRVLQKELREADCDGDGLIDLQVDCPFGVRDHWDVDGPHWEYSPKFGLNRANHEETLLAILIAINNVPKSSRREGVHISRPWYQRSSW